MKNFILIAAFLFLTASCGGGGVAARDQSLGLTVEWPAALLELGAEEYKIAASLIDGEKIIADHISHKTAGENFLFEFKDVGEGEYLLRLLFSYPAESGDIDVATAEKILMLGGSNSIIITADDFVDIGGGDPDGDLLSNLEELRLGLDPYLQDTDGDEIPDGADSFPLSISEWFDTDGDGIGDNTDDDIDGDGLTNSEERALGTNVNKADTDGDGVGDSDDNCRLGANPAQKDTDGDLLGDACDGDSDGDGLSDSTEEELGTDPLLTDTDSDGLSDGIEFDNHLNPLSADSDSDGHNDGVDAFPADPGEWVDSDSDGTGDNADNCRTTPNVDQANTDQALALGGYAVDADLLGDACDGDIDGDGLSAVFVDSTRGSDGNAGTFNAPVATIGRALLVAHQRSEDIYVAGGRYDVAGAAFKNGVNLYGGYDGSTFDLLLNLRNIRSDAPNFCTYLDNSSGPTTVGLNQSHGTFTIEGFHIRNSANTGRSSIIKMENSGVTIKGNTIYGNEDADFSTGIEISGGRPKIEANWIERQGGSDAVSSIGIFANNALAETLIKNNIVRAGRARHTVALKIEDSSAIISNNTLDGTSYASNPNTATGFIFENSAPVAVNNVIVAGPNGRDAFGMRCLGATPGNAVFRNNIFSTFSAGSSNAPVVNCEGEYQYSSAFSVGGSEVEDNYIFEGAFEELLDSGYGLAGVIGVDAGVPANMPEYGLVSEDFDMNSRLGSNFDIGARIR